MTTVSPGIVPGVDRRPAAPRLQTTATVDGPLISWKAVLAYVLVAAVYFLPAFLPEKQIGGTDYFAGDPRTHRERMLAGELYIGGDPESNRITRRAVRLLEQYRVQTIEGDDAAARETLTAVLGHLGEEAVVRPPLTVDYGEGRINTYWVGDTVLEAMDVPHNGVNTGAIPMKLLAVYMGGGGKANTVPLN